MARRPWTVISVGLAVGVILLNGMNALGRETEEQLRQRIESEHNPVKKAKDEVKLANLELLQVHAAYKQGQIATGEKLLGTFVEEMNTSWKILQDSGRRASKQPEGFRELEISLREDERLLQDLGREVNYFDRAPLMNAAQKLDQMRGEVLNVLFPGAIPPTGGGSVKKFAPWLVAMAAAL